MHSGAHVLIEVADDGAGINTDVFSRKPWSGELAGQCLAF
jgi:chemotaxis protein histidine kinase CheA